MHKSATQRKPFGLQVQMMSFTVPQRTQCLADTALIAPAPPPPLVRRVPSRWSEYAGWYQTCH